MGWGVCVSDIEIRDLRKAYGGSQVLCGVNLRITSPGVYLLAGPNGSGKTTLLEILVGLRVEDAGSVSIDGRSASDMETKRHLGFLAQQSALRNNSLVREEVGLVRDLFMLDTDIPEYLRRFDLEGCLGQRTKHLSGGMKRRLLIAMLLMPAYRIVVLDEPASGLDTSSRDEIWNTIRDYSRENIVIVSDHYLNEAAQYSDYVYLLNKGSVVLHGETERLLGEFEMKHVVKARAEYAEAVAAEVAAFCDAYEVRISGTVCNVFIRTDPARVAALMSHSRLAHNVHPVNLEDIYFFYTGDTFDEEVSRSA